MTGTDLSCRMIDPSVFILYLDDYHAGDVLFLQSLARGLAKRPASVRPVILHGSAEHAERVLEASGIFRERREGVLPVESVEEFRMVERAARQLNQKIVSILTDAVVASVGLMGDQRRTFVVSRGRVEAPGAQRLQSLTEQGVVPVVSAFAADEASGTAGEVPLIDAALALARAVRQPHPTIVVFTTTSLPGIMKEGKTVERVAADDPGLASSVADVSVLQRLAAGSSAGVLLTNTTRFSDTERPRGSRVTDGGPLHGAEEEETAE